MFKEWGLLTVMGFHYRNADGTKAKCVGFKELKSCAEPSAPLSVLSEHIGSVIDMAWGWQPCLLRMTLPTIPSVIIGFMRCGPCAWTFKEQMVRKARYRPGYVVGIRTEVRELRPGALVRFLWVEGSDPGTTILLCYFYFEYQDYFLAYIIN